MLSILRSDSGLVSQVLKGKSTQFDELVNRHFSMVYGVAFSYTRNHTDAEDLSQEAFIKAYEKLDTLEDKRKFGHWVSTIARNLGRTWFQRRKREAEIMAEIHSEASDVKEALYDDMREVLEQQIQQLDPIPREVLMIHYFSGKSTGEIAKTMGVSQVAILKRLQRAREALGVKLIHELKVIPPAQLDIKQHRRTIMSSILASGLIWKLSGGGIATVAAGVLTSGKAITTALVGLGIVGATLIVNTAPSSLNESDITSNSSSEELIEIKGTLAALPITPESDPLSTTPKLQLAESSSQVSKSITTVDSSDETQDKYSESLDGAWRVSMGEGQDKGEVHEVGIIKITQVDTTFTIDASNITGVVPVKLRGVLYTESVSILVKSSEPNELQHEWGELKGTLSNDKTTINVSGGLDMSGNGQSDEFIYLRLEKLSDDEAGLNLAMENAKTKLTTLYKAIVEYTRSEETTLTRLSKLTPLYLEDKSILDKVENEVLKLIPISLDSLNFKYSSSPAAQEMVNKFRETKEPSYLLDWENELAKLWGENFPGPPMVLRLANSEYEFVLSANKDGRIVVEEEPSQKLVKYDSGTKTPIKNYPSADDVGVTDNARHRASCQNNMKQLGLVFKMYANEQINEYIPGGFRQVYPEYLSDLNILICPGLRDGKVGYQILYPASNDGFWREIFTKVERLPADEYQYQSTVPWIIEKVSCSNEKGRNVLFVDGHAEHIKDKDWDIKMGPYMEYAYN